MQYPTNMTVQPQSAPGQMQAAAVGQPQTAVPGPTTVVITTQPQQVPALTPLKNWNWRLFDIPDCGLFALSWFCPCVVFGGTAQAIGHSYVLCCTVYLFTLICPFFLPIHILLGCLFRERVRQRFRIRGNLCCDLLAYVLCCPCTLNQEALQADTEQRAQVAGTQGTNGLSIRLGPRVVSLNTDRVNMQSTVTELGASSSTQVPLLSPAVAYAPAHHSAPMSVPSAPVAQPMSSVLPYPVSQQPPIGFALPPITAAQI